MSRPDYGSHTEADAGRYEASTTQDWRDNAPDWDDVGGLEALVRLDRARGRQTTATCGVCGQGVVDPLWCVTCANDKAAEMRSRDREWWSE